MYTIRNFFLIIFLMCSSQYSWCMELGRSIASFEEKLHLPKHTLKVGAAALGTLGAAGLAGVCYHNSSDETIQNILELGKTAAQVTGVLVAGYCAIGAKRGWNLYCLEKELNNAESPTKAKFGRFRYFTWHKDCWPTAQDLRHHEKEVRAVLEHESRRCKDKIFLNGEVIDLCTISSEKIKGSINNEQERLQKTLAYLGSCCDAPRAVVKLLEAKGVYIKDSNSEHDNLYDNIKTFEENIYTQAHWQDYIKAQKPHWFKRWFYFPGKRIWRFCCAPWYSRATNLYCRFLDHYIRLNALKDVADSMSNWDAATERPNGTYNINLTTKETS